MNEYKYFIILYLLVGSIIYLTYKHFLFSSNKDPIIKYVMFSIVLFYPILFMISIYRVLRKKSHLISIFLSSSLQIFFVSVNTILISREMIIQAGICGFLLSLVWTFNIKRIAIASWGERISYCLGAGLGTSGGIFFIKTLREII